MWNRGIRRLADRRRRRGRQYVLVRERSRSWGAGDAGTTVRRRQELTNAKRIANRSGVGYGHELDDHAALLVAARSFVRTPKTHTDRTIEWSSTTSTQY